MTLNEKRAMIGQWLKEDEGDQLWDLMTGLRGPDSPSERGDMTSEEQARAYKGRRARKFKTVEVIRAKAFNGVIGGSARSHHADHITLPPRGQWDHFDRHMERAARVLGLKVVVEEETNKGVEVEVKIPEPPPKKKSIVEGVKKSVPYQGGTMKVYATSPAYLAQAKTASKIFKALLEAESPLYTVLEEK